MIELDTTRLRELTATTGWESEDDRLRGLVAVGLQGDVAAARLVEGHVDALAILREAGLSPAPDGIYGVWASRGSLQLVDGHLTGVKPFCSGSDLLTHALVTATSPEEDGGLVLLEIVVDGPTLQVDGSSWQTTTMSRSRTATLILDHHPISRGPIGAPGWYLDRPGFWVGACRPAAAWAGCALAVIRRVEGLLSADVMGDLVRGRLEGSRFLLEALVARAVELSGPSAAAAGRQRAEAFRLVVADTAHAVLQEALRAVGPRPLVTDPDFAGMVDDLRLYLLQHHGERDVAALGQLLRERRADEGGGQTVRSA